MTRYLKFNLCRQHKHGTNNSNKAMQQRTSSHPSAVIPWLVRVFLWGVSMLEFLYRDLSIEQLDKNEIEQLIWYLESHALCYNCFRLMLIGGIVLNVFALYHFVMANEFFVVVLLAANCALFNSAISAFSKYLRFIRFNTALLKKRLEAV